MKRRTLFLLAAVALAGCSPTYELAQPGDAFLSNWNTDVSSKVLQLKLDSQGDYVSNGGDITVMYRNTNSNPSWMLVTTVEAEADMACTALLLAATKISYGDAASLVKRSVSQSIVKDGNLEFYMNRGNGGAECNVSLTRI